MLGSALTAEEFAILPELEGQDFELVDGCLSPREPNVPLHSLVLGRLSYRTQNYLDRNPIGGLLSLTDCRISGSPVRRPDAAIYLGERWRGIDLDRIVP